MGEGLLAYDYSTQSADSKPETSQWKDAHTGQQAEEGKNAREKGTRKGPDRLHGCTSLTPGDTWKCAASVYGVDPKANSADISPYLPQASVLNL